MGSDLSRPMATVGVIGAGAWGTATEPDAVRWGAAAGVPGAAPRGSTSVTILPSTSKPPLSIEGKTAMPWAFCMIEPGTD